MARGVYYDAVFAMSVRLMSGEPIDFEDGVGNRYLATANAIVLRASGDPVAHGDAFEIAREVLVLRQYGARPASGTYEAVDVDEPERRAPRDRPSSRSS